MIVFTMTDLEVLNELQQEVDNDLVKRLQLWIEKSYPEYKFEKIVFDKLVYLKSHGGKLMTVEFRDTKVIQVALDPLVYKTKLGNTFIIIPSVYLNKKLQVVGKRIGYLLKVPGKYKYFPKNSKNPILRDGYQYFVVSFDYNYYKDGSSKYRKPKIHFIRVTSHFLDRLSQRSKFCQECIHSCNVSSIQAFKLIENGTTAYPYFKEDVYDTISQLSNEEIEKFPPERQMEIFSVQHDISFIDFGDGCIVCIPGIENRRMTVLKTFLTKEQAREYTAEMNFMTSQKFLALKKMMENECYY